MKDDLSMIFIIYCEQRFTICSCPPRLSQWNSIKWNVRLHATKIHHNVRIVFLYWVSEWIPRPIDSLRLFIIENFKLYLFHQILHERNCCQMRCIILVSIISCVQCETAWYSICTEPLTVTISININKKRFTFTVSKEMRIFHEK